MVSLFKDRNEMGMSELKRDAVFSRIPPDLYGELIDFGWHIGESTAKVYVQKLGTTVPSQMAKKFNLSVKSEDWEPGRSNVKIYSEYDDKLLQILLHPNIIKVGIEKAKASGVDQVQNYAVARELFLAHEIFHHLECREIGLTSKKRQIVTFQIGPFSLKSGLRSLCEIAAHAFTRTLYDMNEGYPHLKQKDCD